MQAKAILVERGFGKRAGVMFRRLVSCTLVATLCSLAAVECELALNFRCFHAEQAFVQSEVDDGVYKGRGETFGKMIRYCCNLYSFEQVSRQLNRHLVRSTKGLGVEQCDVDDCAISLEALPVDGTFAIGLESTCDKCCGNQDESIPINHLGVLRL